jgi:hypothetical protein
MKVSINLRLVLNKFVLKYRGMNINNKIDLFLTYCEFRSKLLPIVIKSQKTRKIFASFSRA